jgi:GT2 family glycosyltransferase
MDVTILICTLDRAADLRETLSSVAALAPPPGCEVEVLVVDNGSREALAAAPPTSARLPVRLLVEGRRGKSHALNRGVAEARGRVVLFTDDDVRVPPDWIERLAGPILRDEADLVGGGVRLAPHLERPWMGDLHRAWLAHNLSPDGAAVTFIAGANMAVSAEWLRRLGPFDPELGPGPEGLGNAEDTLLVYQAQRAGARVLRVAAAPVLHELDAGRLSRRWFLDAAVARGRSDAYLAHHWEHRRPPGLLARWRAEARLALEQRRAHPPDHATADELWLWKQAAFGRQFARESGRPRKYPPPADPAC